jgi:hypothetical protein
MALEFDTGLIYMVILNEGWLGGYVESNSLLGVEIDYGVLAYGGLADVTNTKAIAYEHRALKPYAPTHVSATANDPTPGDTTLTWVRRTRQGGGWNANLDTVPLAEDTEAYQIDILSGPGGSVLRTLSSIVETVVYTEAEADYDFGSGGVPSPLYVRVYQMSAQIGRGFSNEVALALE